MPTPRSFATAASNFFTNHRSSSTAGKSPRGLWPIRQATPLARVLSLIAIGLVATTLGASEPTAPPAALGFSDSSWDEQLRLEASFDGLLRADELEAYIKRMSARPHHVGSPHGRANAEWMVETLRSWGWQADVAQYEILFPTPKHRHLELIEPTSFVASLEEPPVPGDASSSQKDEQLPSYNAYSIDGDVTAPLVYVNYGIPEDYEELDKRGISVEGKIVLARYGRSWRGIKPKVAAEHGAVGCILYSDPGDDGFGAGEVYPKGGYRPAKGVQRGSVADMPVYPGDPSTPMKPSLPGVEPLPLSEIQTLTKIPTLPISYSDALPLLEALGGPVTPRSWRGGLATPYRFGPGASKVRLAVAFDWNRVTASNVVAKMVGHELPDQWIVRGNHHDAWVHGATDPVSGMAAVLTEAKALGALAKAGWKPRRTLVYAGWDAEEPGLIGSTEWVEHHKEELKAKAVAYINSDSNGRGFLSAGGSHSLERFVNEVAQSIEDPQVGGSIVDRVLAARHLDNPSDAKETSLALYPLGSGSDYSPFLQHLGIASLNIGFGGEGHYGQYHSGYDTFEHYKRFMDPTFDYGVALAKVVGHMVLRLANADVLPFEFTALADRVSTYIDEIEQTASDMRAATKLHNQHLATGVFQKAWDPKEEWVLPPAKEPVPHLDFSPLRNALASLRHHSDELRRIENMHQASSELRALVDQLLFSSERRLTHEEGLPERSWYVHYLYAPGFYTGYGVKTLPAVREAVEARRWSEVEAGVQRTAEVLESLARQLAKIHQEVTSETGVH